MKKKLIILAAVMTLALSWSITACAQPEVMPDGAVFDAEYYAQENPDVVAALGTDTNMLYLHYTQFGKAEGRAAVAPTPADYVRQVMNIVNEERIAAGLSTLSWDDTIAKAAYVRAAEISMSFSHTRPDGRNCFTILEEYGIRNVYMGENIAYGFTTSESVMEGWMNSPGHRENILKPQFSRIGVGYYIDASGRANWVQLFAS